MLRLLLDEAKALKEAVGRAAGLLRRIRGDGDDVGARRGDERGFAREKGREEGLGLGRADVGEGGGGGGGSCRDFGLN